MWGRYAPQRGASPLATINLLATTSLPATKANPPHSYLMPCCYSTSTRNTSNPNCSYASTLGTCHSVINV